MVMSSVKKRLRLVEYFRQITCTIFWKEKKTVRKQYGLPLETVELNRVNVLNRFLEKKFAKHRYITIYKQNHVFISLFSGQVKVNFFTF